MICVVTNIYNNKTKGPTLMELFTATGKLKKFILTTKDVRCVHHGWHGTHRYDIQVLARHVRQHGCIVILQRCSDLSKLFIPRTNCLVCRRVLCVLCTKCTLHSNHRLTRVIFQHTKRLFSQSDHFLTTYIRVAQRQKCELRWKTTYWGKKNFELFLLSVQVL